MALKAFKLSYLTLLHLVWPAIALSTSASCGQEQDAFTDLQYVNWQRAVDAYDKGFGGLTSQAVPVLLILGAVNAAGNPNVPLPAGPPFFQYADPATVRQALAKAGFVDVDVTTVDWMEWHVDSADELYEIFLEGTARTRELLRGQTETEAEAVREELRRRFRERRGALRMPAVVSSGQKPL